MNKFNIGESLWFLYNNKATQGVVYEIVQQGEGSIIQYSFRGITRLEREDEVFKTKEELIKSL